jgi:hypothetical protein
MPNKLAVPLLFAAVAMCVIVLPVQAKRFNTQDSNALIAITKCLGVANKDSIDIFQSLLNARNLDANECLSRIIDAVGIPDEIISSITTLISLSNIMESKADEDAVDQALAAEIRYGLASIAAARKSINQQTGYCGSSPIVINKAQNFLLILDDGAGILSAFSRRF